MAGDVHGNFGWFNRMLNKKRPDLVICCGDFGYWPKLPGHRFEDIRPQGSKILWCDGNHEDHWSLRDREKDEIVPNVIYMPRGSTYKLPDGRNILFMGGADSIDKNARWVGVDWFPEEVINQKDFENLPDEKVDIVVSHTCPDELTPNMLKHDPRKTNDPSTRALSQIWKIYQPELWYFAHWHTYETGMFMSKTRWFCLNKIPSTNWWKWLEPKL